MRKKPLTEQEIEQADAAYWGTVRRANSLAWEAEKKEKEFAPALRYFSARSGIGAVSRGIVRRAYEEVDKAEGQAARLDRRRRCGARTRKGTPCQCKPEPGQDRCKLHGGKSTGPKTEAGREAIRESNRRRAQARRDALQLASL